MPGLSRLRAIAETHPDHMLYVVVTFVVGALQVATWSPEIGLGDAPETLRAAQEWSVAHAPGYPLHISVAALCIRIIPVVSDAAAVNLPSSLATVASAAMVAALARRTGASRVAAAIAACGWAAAASVWFYAGFAKHDALTTLWLAILMHSVIALTDGASRVRPFAVGLMAGASLGLGWAPIASAGLGLAYGLVAMPGRRRRIGVVLLGGVAGMVACGALVLAMSASSPETSWGAVDGPGRLVDLWTMDDFGLLDRASGAEPASQSRRNASFAADVAGYGAVVARDLGPALAVAGLVGLVSCWRRGWRREAGTLALTLVGNVAVLVLLLSIEPWGFRSGIVQGGFFGPSVLVLAVGAATCLDDVVEIVSRWVDARLAWVVVAVLVVGTSVVAHRPAATHVRAAVADSYAQHTLADLPERAVVVTGTASSAFPLLAAQTAGMRTDVVIVMADGLTTQWYRDQVREVHPTLPLPADAFDLAESTSDLDDEGWSVYLDHGAQELLEDHVAYTPTGVLGSVHRGEPGFAPPADPGRLVAHLADQVRTSGLDRDPGRGRWPTDEITGAYTRPLLLIAQSAINERDWPTARAALAVALQLEPQREIVRDTLARLPS